MNNISVIVGHKGDVNTNEYVSIAEAFRGDGNNYCSINFTALEYDTTDGQSMYQSLQAGDKYVSYGTILF